MRYNFLMQFHPIISTYGTGRGQTFDIMTFQPDGCRFDSSTARELRAWELFSDCIFTSVIKDYFTLHVNTWKSFIVLGQAKTKQSVRMLH